jgi:CRP-like cAMP-binding protein
VRDANYNFEGIPLLSALTRAERDELVRQCRFKRYDAGEHIIDGQSDSRDVYFIIEGTARVVNYSVSGREVTLDDISAGGFFGELAAVDGGRRSAFVMPQGSEAVAAAMPPEVFLGLMARKPVVAMEIMKRLAKMVRQASERIMDLSTLGANNRIHAELLRQAKAVSADGRQASITPIPLHSDIASRVSTTRETVARVLNDLARSRIVERKKNALIVHDILRLEELVEDVRGNC